MSTYTTLVVDVAFVSNVYLLRTVEDAIPAGVVIQVNVNVSPLMEMVTGISSNFFLSVADIKPSVEAVAASWLCELGVNDEGLPVMFPHA